MVSGNDIPAQNVADGALRGWLPPEPWVLGLFHISLRGLCQGPVKGCLTLLGTGICIPIILLSQPIHVQGCLELSKAPGIIYHDNSWKR